MVPLGLRCSVWAFSSCREQGLPSSCSAWASHWNGSSRGRAQVLDHVVFSSSREFSSLCAQMGIYKTHCKTWLSPLLSVKSTTEPCRPCLAPLSSAQGTLAAASKGSALAICFIPFNDNCAAKPFWPSCIYCLHLCAVCAVLFWCPKG